MRFSLKPSFFAVAALTLVFSIHTQAGDRIDPASARITEGDETTLWYDIRALGVEGRGWDDTKEFYDRLPAKAEAMVRPPVWSLSRNSTGMCVRFITDADAIAARWNLRSDRLDMPHMPATGVSGVDLYVRLENGRWHWLATGRPSKKEMQQNLVSGIPSARREYLLYLPLYNGVSLVELGLPKTAVLEQAPPRPEGKQKPILFYGTSITQGGCASRTGMVHTAIIGRHLDRPVINLGFSGNGKMEPELAELLAELDPAVYVLDCLPNMGPADVAERVVPFVTKLRESRPDTPILLVEDRNYTDGFLVPSRRERNEGNQAEFKKAFEKLTSDGVKHLHYLKGDNLLGDDGEGTVDGSHPTDLGFMRQAKVMETALRPILGDE